MNRPSTALLLFTAIILSLTPALADTQHFRWQEDNFGGLFSRVDLEIRGTVEFTDNDSDVKSISSDGYFRLEQSTGPIRTYLVRPGSNGMERLYSVEGVSKPLDAEGKAWLARVLPEIIRESAIGAPERVKRILRLQGVGGVLAEVNKIRSDHSRRVYLENLLDYGRLSNEDLHEAMRLGRKISSDGEKASFLVSAAPHYQTAATRESYFDSVDTVSSDGEHRRVLASVLERYGMDRETLALALRSAKRISSDGEKAAVLEQAADFRQSDDIVRSNYFRAADSISSDGEHKRVLSAVLKKNSDRDTLVRALRSASGINSDGEKCAVLIEAAQVYVDDPIVRRAFFDTAGTVSSDGERQHALSALLKRADWSADTLREVAKSASHMSSDGEKAAVLVGLADAAAKDLSVAEALVAAANTISSDGEHSKVLMAVLNAGTLKADAVVLIIHSAEKISSDGEKARVLARAAQRYSSDTQVLVALRGAAKTIQSDGEYRRVMSALDRGKTL